MVQKLKRVVAGYNSFEFDINDTSLDALVQQCYADLVVWFGVPADPEKRVNIAYGPGAGMSRRLFLRDYQLLLTKERLEPHLLLCVVAHEMYHRITLLRKGLHRYFWVDEMLAAIASLKVVEKAGYIWYVDGVRDLCFSNTSPIPFATLKEFKTSPLLRFDTKSSYPDGYSEAITTFGLRLEDVCGWDKMCLLTWHKSWEEWLKLFSPEQSARLRLFLKL